MKNYEKALEYLDKKKEYQSEISDEEETKIIRDINTKMANDEVTKAEAEDIATTSEGPAQKFSRIASKRLQNVLDAMRVLRNCSGPGYGYTPEQVDKMEKYIQDEFDKLKAAFRGEEVVEKPANLL